MASVIITGPDGQRYRMGIPEGASDAEVSMMARRFVANLEREAAAGPEEYSGPPTPMLPQSATTDLSLSPAGRQLASVLRPAAGAARDVMAAQEAAAMLGSGTVAEPVAGLAGAVAMPFVGAERAGDVVRGAREAMTYMPTEASMERISPVIEAGIEAIPEDVKAAGRYVGEQLAEFEEGAYQSGGPLAGAVAATLPAAAAEAVPVLGAMRKGARAVRTVEEAQAAAAEARRAAAEAGAEADELEAVAASLARRAPPSQARAALEAGTTVPDAEREAVARAARRGTLAEQVDPDPEIVAAAAAEEIDLPSSAVSRNPAFIEIEQRSKSLPGSGGDLVRRELFAIDELGRRADDLITDLGGDIQRDLTDPAIKSEFETLIRDHEVAADSAYSGVRSLVPETTLVDVSPIRALLDAEIERLGGGDVGRRRLYMSDLYRRVDRYLEGPVTYGALDDLRKDVGEGFRGRGAYADSGSRQLSQVYGALSDAQEAALEGVDPAAADLYRIGRAAAQQQKALQDSSIELFGKELQGSIISKMRSAATALTGGDVSKMEKLLAQLPSDEARQRVAATMLNDLFTLGARTRRGEMSIGGFSTAFDLLERNKGARDALFRNLPAGSAERYRNLGLIAKGLNRAMSRENKSRTARDVLAAALTGGWLSKLMGRVATGAGRAAEGVGIPGGSRAGDYVAGAVGAVDETRAKALDRLLASREFSTAVEMAARGQVERAERLISETAGLKQWAALQPREVRAEIATAGFIPWLFGDEEPAPAAP